MNMYLWDRVDGATTNYHDEGGIVVIADSLERAREIIAAKTDFRPCGALREEPDLVRGCDGPEIFIVFPDAGCC